MSAKSIVILLLSCLFFSLPIPVHAEELAPTRTIQFSGYTWVVRTGGGGPGPNCWASENVQVDASGYLHLKIGQVNGQWCSAEVYMDQNQRLGFGTYQWQVIGRVDQLDPNVVLGLFNYPPDSSVGPDGTNEIDIEFAHWGDPTYPIGNYTVYPALTGPKPRSRTFTVSLNGDYTTHRFAWSSNQVVYQSLHGHTDRNTNQFQRWAFVPAQPQRQIPQVPLPVHMNLWLFKGRTPTDGQGVEVIIKKFTYTPGPATTTIVDAQVETDDQEVETAPELRNTLFLPVTLYQ